MLTDRFNPGRLRRGFIKSLSMRSGSGSRPDLGAVYIVVLIPLAVGAVAWLSGFRLVSPGSILGGLSLLVGGLLAAFGQIASWRARLADRERLHDRTEASDRDLLDEAATDVLAASLASLVGVFAIVIGEAVTSDKAGALTGFWCGVVVTIGVFIGLVFLMVVLRLYDAYVYLNHVSDHLNGSIQD